MKAQKLFFLLWNTIGLFVLVGIVTFLVEFYNHGANWDGVYKAHFKHMERAESQVMFGE